MKPSQVRESVLRDHVALRGRLARIEALARTVESGESWRVRDLRAAGEALLDALREHMLWEDRHLGPTLRDADAWGEERQAQLERDHREQREVLSHALGRLRDSDRHHALVARDLLAFASLLREDMEDEESSLLDPRVLRDDVIGIDVEAG